MKKLTRAVTALVLKGYDSFKSQMDKVDNKADLYAKADIELSAREEQLREAKALIDADLKKQKVLRENLRKNMIEYMGETGTDKVEGNVYKSITYYAKKEIEEIAPVKEVKIGNKYVPVDEVDLLKLVESLGGKVRVSTKTTKKIVKPTIRVIK